MGIKKNRETQIITIRDIPISYQDITTDVQKANLSHRFYDRNPDRTLNLTINKERSHGQHTKTDEITQLDTTNQPKIHLLKSKSSAASYLARKTSDPGKS